MFYRFKSELAICITCVSLLASTLVFSSFMGCGTNAPTKAAQAEQVLITSVNVGVKQIVAAINAGKLTAKQCEQFKTAYMAYYDAQQVARAAIEKFNANQPGATAQDMADAQTAVSNAEQTLLALINSLLGK